MQTKTKVITSLILLVTSLLIYKAVKIGPCSPELEVLINGT